MTALFGRDGLRLLVARGLAAEIEVRLAVGWPPSPRRGLTAQDFPEPVGGGYVRRSVAAGTWALSVSDAGIVTAEAPLVIFRFSGPMDNARSVLGHVLVDKTTGTLLWAERYEVSVPVPEAGELEVTPVYEHGAEVIV